MQVGHIRSLSPVRRPQTGHFFPANAVPHRPQSDENASLPHASQHVTVSSYSRPQPLHCFIPLYSALLTSRPSTNVSPDTPITPDNALYVQLPELYIEKDVLFGACSFSAGFSPTAFLWFVVVSRFLFFVFYWQPSHFARHFYHFRRIACCKFFALSNFNYSTRNSTCIAAFRSFSALLFSVIFHKSADSHRAFVDLYHGHVPIMLQLYFCANTFFITFISRSIPSCPLLFFVVFFLCFGQKWFFDRFTASGKKTKQVNG